MTIQHWRKKKEHRQQQARKEHSQQQARKDKKNRITDLKSRRRAGASGIVTRDRRESCEEAAVLEIIQVVNSQSGEVVITVPTVGFNDARTRVPSCGTWEAWTRPDF